METDNKRPNAALINREWYESASSIMAQEDLAMVVLNACRYVFGLPEVAMRNQSQHIVFAMVKPALDSDIAKYAERCERNQRNARSQSQRVGASGSQSQRVGATPTPTPTPTTTTTSTTTTSLSPVEVEEKERWIVFGYFWSTGSKAIKEELTAFWSYYESLGWKNNKGAAIVSKLAAARMWKRQFELGVVPNGADAWFKAVQACPVTDYNIWLSYAGAERNAEVVTVRLRCSGEYLSKLKAAVPTLERDLRGVWRAAEVNFETAG